MVEVRYRNIHAGDFDALHELCSDWDTVRQLGSWPWPPDPDFTRTRAKTYEGNGFVWAICVDDKLVGTVAVTDGILGYMLHPKFSGAGLMSAAVAQALEKGFKDVERITACTWFDNLASARVLTKAGFEMVGRCVDRSIARGADVETHSYALTRSQWQTLRSQAQ